jgi:hypothetical protein
MFMAMNTTAGQTIARTQWMLGKKRADTCGVYRRLAGAGEDARGRLSHFDVRRWTFDVRRSNSRRTPNIERRTSNIERSSHSRFASLR